MGGLHLLSLVSFSSPYIRHGKSNPFCNHFDILRVTVLACHAYVALGLGDYSKSLEFTQAILRMKFAPAPLKYVIAYAYFATHVFVSVWQPVNNSVCVVWTSLPLNLC